MKRGRRNAIREARFEGMHVEVMGNQGGGWSFRAAAGVFLLLLAVDIKCEVLFEPRVVRSLAERLSSGLLAERVFADPIGGRAHEVEELPLIYVGIDEQDVAFGQGNVHAPPGE